MAHMVQQVLYKASYPFHFLLFCGLVHHKVRVFHTWARQFSVNQNYRPDKVNKLLRGEGL